MANLAYLVEAAEKRNKEVFLSRLTQCVQDELRKSQVLHIVCRNGWLDVVKELIVIYHMSLWDFLTSSLTVPHHGGGASPVHLACTSGNLELVQYLMDKRSWYVNECTADGLSTIHCAIMGGLHIVKYLVELHPDLTTSMFIFNYVQMILFAYYNWDNDLMKYLIVQCECCTIINESTGDSILHYACRDGYIARLRFLIEECECDSCVLNRSGHTLLYTVCSSYDKQKQLCVDMLMYLTNLYSFDIKHELKRNKDGLNTVECAIMVRWMVAVKRLVALCDDQDDKYRIISYAYYHWDDSIMRYLIAKLGIVTNGITGNTLLHNTCRDMSLDKIRFIAAEMSNVTDFNDIVDMNRNTLLHAFSGFSVCTPSSAVSSYLKPMCKYFKNAFNYTPLEWAIVHQTLPMLALASVRCLVEEYGSDELHGGRILALAFQHWSDDLIKYLLVEMKGSPVTDVSNGDTILHMACRIGNIKQVKFLIETCHCNPNVINSSYNESLIHAASNCFDILRYLCIECHYHTDLSGHQYVMGTIAMKSAIAQKEKGLAVVKHLVEKCQVEGNSEIMSHVYRKWYPAIVKYLIVNAKFDLYCDCDSLNNTILHLSAIHQDHKRLKYLIDICHCSPHIKNEHGESLIHATCNYHNWIEFGILRYLCINCNCCPDLSDGSQTVGTIAIESAISQKECGLAVVKHLVEKCKVKSSCEIMSFAWDNWCEAVIEYLIVDAKFDLTTDHGIHTGYGNTILHYCIFFNGHFKRMKFLIETCHCTSHMETLIASLVQEIRKIDFITQFSHFSNYFRKLHYLLVKFANHTILVDCHDVVKTAECCYFSQYQLRNCAEVIYFLVKNCIMSPLNQAHQDDICSILYIAYKMWHKDALKCLLLDKKCKITVDSSTGDTVLHYACSEMNLSKLHFLLEECKCDIEISNLKGETILHKLSVIPTTTQDFNLWFSIVAYIIELHGSYKDLLTSACFQHKSDDMMKYINPLVTDDMSNGDTMLYMACRIGNIKQVKFFIETCHCNPHFKNTSQNESLIHAATNDFDILQYLCIECDCYTDLSGRQDAGTSAIQLAIAQKEKGLAVVKHLVEKCKVESSCEIMSSAWDNWCEAVMKYLIVDAKFDLTTDIHTGYTVLHHCVCSINGHFDQMKFFIETCHCTSHIETLIPALIQEIKKIDLIYTQLSDFSEYFHKLYYLLVKFAGSHHTIVVNCADIAKIVECCYYNQMQNKTEIIYLLVKHCVVFQSTNYTLDNDICSILYITYKIWHESALKCLLLDKKYKMVVDTLTGDTLLHYVCSEMNQLKLKFLLEECKCDIEVSNLKGETILHTLCIPPTTQPFHDFDLWFSIVKYIIEIHNFHNLVLQDNFGNTVFHLICSSTEYSKPCVIDYLLLNCTSHDLNLKNKDGYTVLHLLCRLASHDPLTIDLIRRLIQDGKGNPLLEDPDMNSILHILASSWLAPVYSTGFLSLIHYLLYDCQLDSSSVNNQGDTVLHVSCRNFKGDIALIEQVISTGKVDMLTMNNLDETPLMLLDNRCRDLKNNDAIKKVKQLIDRFGEVQLTHSIHSYVKVVLVGNPGVGKSTLCKVIKSRKKYAIAAQFIYRNVKNVELHTAGIVTKIIKDKNIGRIVLHDLAGQAEYYSSHTAVLENLLQGSAAVFVAVISLADENCIKSFHQWFNIIENVSHNALHQCHLIVVASHIDQSVVTDLNQLKQSIFNICSPSPNKTNKSVLKSHGIFELDCRKLGGNYLTSFISALSIACKSITDKNTREMSLYCHMLYDFFQHDGKSSYTLASLIELSENTNGLFLPNDIKLVESIVSQLSSTGLVLYLRSKTELSKSWVVADKSVLLSELNGVLFAPHDFKQHVQDISSNTGVVKLSHLYSIFPNYDPELLLQFLQYMELCSFISKKIFNMQPLPIKDNDEQYIFVPALIKSTEKPDISQTVFKFGRCLRCIKHAFFISRFIHLVQLHLACKFSIMKLAAPSKFERLCKIWTKGIHWKNTKSVEALVEVNDSNQTLLVLMSCEDGCESDMFNLIHDVLAEILSYKQQVMPRVVTYDFVINNSNLQRSLNSLDNVPLYSVQLLASCYLNNDQFVLDDTSGENYIAISKIVAHGDRNTFFNAIFAGRDPNCLANAENMARNNAVFQSSIQDSSEIIKVPTSIKFFHLLRTKSMNWDDIGRELGICLSDRNRLRSSFNSENLSDNHCLESILDQWVESSNPNMLWDQFKAAMKRLQYNDVLEMMERSGTESHETDLITSTGSDSPIKMGLQTQLTSTNSEVAIPKELLVSSDVIVEPSTLSPIPILKSHTPQLLGLISDPHKLAIDLWSADLLSDAAKDEVETNMSLSRYRKGSYVMNEIIHLISSMDSEQQIETFEKFCSVLKSEGDPGLERISIKMSTALTKSVDLNLDDVLGCVIEVIDWSSLGLALGLPHHEIERIRQDGYSERDKLTRMVSMWLKSGTNTSWECLVEALRHPSVDEISLASRIAHKYL